MTLPLRDRHIALGARWTTVESEEIPFHYGDPIAEHLAVRESAGLADRSHRGVWRLTGPDAARYLHGLLSNDIESLQPGQGCAALLLTARGGIVCDLVVHRRSSEEFFLHASAETRVAGFAELHRFLVGDDAAIEDVSNAMGMLGVYGPAAREATATLWTEPIPPMPEGHFTERRFGEDAVLVSATHWTGEEGVELLAARGAISGLWDPLLDALRVRGGRAVGEAALETLRVEAGTPRAGVDFDQETIPQQAGLERAVSFTKGCYRGQEIVLRVRTRGHANRTLVGLALEGLTDALPARGTKLHVDGQEKGWITSAIHAPTLGRPIALGYLHRTATAPGTLVEVATIPPRGARVVSLPFYRRHPP